MITPKRHVLISLGQRAIDSRVWIDDIEITRLLIGVEVRAFVDAVSQVTLHLAPSDVELTGAVGQLLKTIPTLTEVMVCASCGLEYGHAKNCAMPTAPKVRSQKIINDAAVNHGDDAT